MNHSGKSVTRKLKELSRSLSSQAIRLEMLPAAFLHSDNMFFSYILLRVARGYAASGLPDL